MTEEQSIAGQVRVLANLYSYQQKFREVPILTYSSSTAQPEEP